MINPQKGIDLYDNNSIIIRILYVVTIFQQTSVALSSVEAKYMAASTVSCEDIWLHKVLSRLFDEELDPIVIYCDNQSCIKPFENPVFCDRSKNIEIKYHFI